MGAEILGLAPEDCLVIEDSASGARAGHAAGCTVLATLFSHSVESLSYADYIVRSLEDVHVRRSGRGGRVSQPCVSRPSRAACRRKQSGEDQPL